MSRAPIRIPITFAFTVIPPIAAPRFTTTSTLPPPLCGPTASIREKDAWSPLSIPNSPSGRAPDSPGRQRIACGSALPVVPLRPVLQLGQFVRRRPGLIVTVPPTAVGVSSIGPRGSAQEQTRPQCNRLAVCCTNSVSCVLIRGSAHPARACVPMKGRRGKGKGQATLSRSSAWAVRCLAAESHGGSGLPQPTAFPVRPRTSARSSLTLFLPRG